MQIEKLKETIKILKTENKKLKHEIECLNGVIALQKRDYAFKVHEIERLEKENFELKQYVKNKK